MDPDSVTEAFDALLKNKKPFLAQIVYISEQMTSVCKIVKRKNQLMIF